MKALSVESRVYPQLIYRLIFLLFGLYQDDLVDVENDLAYAEDQFEEGESKDTATEAVLSSRDMSELNGMLDANEVLYHHAFLPRTPPFTRSCFARHPSRVLASPAALHAFLLRPPPFARSCFARRPSRVLASPAALHAFLLRPPPFARSCFTWSFRLSFAGAPATKSPAGAGSATAPGWRSARRPLSRAPGHQDEGV
jgi:hypothetical protein